MNDLIYRWKEKNPVQMVANLSLPGGFKLDGFGNLNCDVKTATGEEVSLSLSLLFGRLKCLYLYSKVFVRKEELTVSL